MPEFSDEPIATKFNLAGYLALVRRRHLQFLIPLLLGWAAVWGASWFLKPHYKSSALVLVQEPALPVNSTGSDLSKDNENQLESMSQQILSRTRLQTIIDKFHLYDRGGLTPDAQVEKMRKDIFIELARGPQSQEITSFTVQYSARDPRTAQQVTSELLDLFINGNSQLRQQASEGNTKVIESELEGAREKLSQEESALQSFEETHRGALPSQSTAGLQILSGLQSQLQNEQQALSSAEQQRISLETLITQQSTAPATKPSSSELPSSDLLAIDQELSVQKSKLASLRLHYTDLYPDVQNTQQEIARLEKRRSEIASESRSHVRSGQSTPASSANTYTGSVSPILQKQLDANQATIDSHQRVIAGLRDRISGYQSRVSGDPAQAQKFNELTANYERAKTEYNDLLTKKNASQMTTNMEQMQKGAQFIMLDPPSLPTKPYYPNHLKFCGIGLGLGLAMGLVIAAGFEFMDDRLHDEKEIRSLLPFAVLSEIPDVLAPAEERKGKRRTALGWSVAGLTIAAIMVGSVFSFLHD